MKIFSALLFILLLGCTILTPARADQAIHTTVVQLVAQNWDADTAESDETNEGPDSESQEKIAHALQPSTNAPGGYWDHQLSSRGVMF